MEKKTVKKLFIYLSFLFLIPLFDGLYLFIRKHFHLSPTTVIFTHWPILTQRFYFLLIYSEGPLNQSGLD